MQSMRTAATIGFVLGIVLLTVQTGAFSRASADRGVDIAVVNDDDAYLGIEKRPVSVTSNESENASLVRLTNRFSRSLELVLTIAESDTERLPDISSVDGPTVLQSGESESIRATVRCDNLTATETATVGIQASNDGTRVVANRTIQISCA